MDVSVLTTMSVIEMGVPRVIAKALSPEQGSGAEQARSRGCISGEGYGSETWEETVVQ